ncbi:MAG: GNAT family N-acetyltransferase [Rhodocyclaceae bacterium]|nr:GNAT family N-acetyltransferase [Rhodocyclaceae bacterium]
MEVATLAALGTNAKESLFRLRHRVFKERLDWSVESDDGMELDAFDDGYARYVLGSEGSGHVCGCMRLIPTHRPYMLAEVFPELAPGVSLPRDPDIWEMSRFAFDTEDEGATRWGFSDRALALIREAVRFAIGRGIARYVLVTTVAVERMMLRQRLHCHRLGPPRLIGGVRSVALVLEVDQATQQALGISAECPANWPANRAHGGHASIAIAPSGCGVHSNPGDLCSLYGTAACAATPRH